VDTFVLNGKILFIDEDKVARFSGAASTHGRLVGGPVRDLNLIVKAGQQSEMAITKDPVLGVPLPPGAHLVIVLAGSASVELVPQPPIPLAVQETLLVELDPGDQAKLSLRPAPESRVALMHIN
jgi:hypothetical protein